MVENKFKVGDKVRVIHADYLDEDVVEVGDIFVVEKAYVSDEEPKAYIDVTTKDNTDWCLYEWQVELVEEDKKPFRVGQPKTNYIQETIELLEEDKKDEHNDYHALESAIREVDREIAQRALELEMLKEARDKMFKVLMMKGK